MKMQAPIFHKRPMASAAAGALLGVLACTMLLGSVWPILAAVVLLALAFFSRKNGKGRFLFFLFAGCMLIRSFLVPSDMIRHGTYTVEGVVCETPEYGKRQTTVVLNHVKLNGEDKRCKISLKLPTDDIRYGDVIVTEADLNPNVDGINARQTGIFANGVGRTPKVTEHRQDLYGELLNLRAAFSAALDRLYADQAANAKGMLLGDRSAISYNKAQQYANSGILHLFAVSGMHMTVLITVLGTLVRIRKRWLNLLILMLFSAIYCALTEFTPSVLRAAFFLFAMQFARIHDRQADPPSAYCFSFVCALLFRPYSLFSASFLLSFGAMAGLILLSDPIKNFLKLPGGNVSGALTGSIGAIAGTLPVQAYFFGELPIYAIPMSFLIGMLLPVFMPLAFLSMFLSPFMPHVAKGLSVVPYGSFLYIDRLTGWISTGSVSLRSPHPIAALLYYLGLLFCSRLFLPNGKQAPYIGIGLFLLSGVIWILL